MPDDFKLLKKALYGGSCCKCGQTVAVGSPARWSPSTKLLACEACRNQPVVGEDPWVKLVRYLKRCVALEAADSLVEYSNTKRWATVESDFDAFYKGSSLLVPPSDNLARIAGQLQSDESLQYGWPTVVLADRKGVVRVAPLFSVELEASSEGSYVAADEFGLNDSLLSDTNFAPEDIDALRRAFDSASGRISSCLEEVCVIVGTAVGAGSTDANAMKASHTVRQARGLYNQAIAVRSQNSMITRSLTQELDELERKTDWRETAASQLVLGLTANAIDKAPDFASPLSLSDSQEQALRALSQSSLTVVTGPPGTGKSQLVVAATATAWLNGESTLLASTNNAAVDVAVQRAHETHKGLLIRTGNKEQRDQLAARVSHLLKDASAREHSNIDLARLRAELSRAERGRSGLHQKLDELRGYEAKLEQLVCTGQELEQSLWPEGRAASVTAEIVLEAARKASRVSLFRRRKKRKLLARFAVDPSQAFGDLAAWSQATTDFELLKPKLKRLEDDIGDPAKAVESADSQWREASAAATVATVQSAIKAKRAAVSALGATRSGGPGLAGVMRSALGGARGWACTALSMKPNFPLEPGLFDQVIIDEAAQCTLAAALPLAYRAKRLVVVGDPNQLTPIIKLDTRTLSDAATSVGLDPVSLASRGQDFGTGSAFLAFAAVVGQKNVHLLDEHYRCHPAIARWFNKSFYGGMLTVLTDVQRMTSGDRGLVWVDVASRAEKGTRGSCRNRAEAEAVIEQLSVLMTRGLGVGVVTPFAAQAELIRDLAFARFGAEALHAVDFAASTAHRFQGGERDIMIFSAVVAPGIVPRSASWIEDQRNLLNVAASRAKQSLIVVGHPTASEEFNVPTLESLRCAAMEGLEGVGASWKVHSDSERRLLDAMIDAGLAPIVKPVEEGYELDFALIVDGLRLNVEVDGVHHVDARGRQRRQDVARDAVLAGLGWRVVRVPAWRCLSEAGTVASELRAKMASNAHESQALPVCEPRL